MIVVAVSLISLGLRLPSSSVISASGKPKPRPRAIIKCQIETCKKLINKVPLPVALIDVHQSGYNPLNELSSLPELTCIHQFVVAAQKLSRAPPQRS